MPNGTPSCPEHDAIAQLIRQRYAIGEGTENGEAEILFEALAAVDGRRYDLFHTGENTAVTYWVFDRWTGAYAPDAQPFAGHVDGIAVAYEHALADAAERNRVNVAARAQELADQLDGYVPPPADVDDTGVPA